MGDLNLTGFLFGNIDEEGRLEDDFLDEELKNALNKKGLGEQLSLDIGIQKEDVEITSTTSSTRSLVHQTEIKVSIQERIDFSNIEEAVPDIIIAPEQVKLESMEKPVKPTTKELTVQASTIQPSPSPSSPQPPTVRPPLTTEHTIRFVLTSDGKFLRHTEFFAGGKPAHTLSKYRMRRLRPNKRKAYLRAVDFVSDQVDLFRRPSSSSSSGRRSNILQRYYTIAQSGPIGSVAPVSKSKKVIEVEEILGLQAQKSQSIHLPKLPHPEDLCNVPDAPSASNWKNYHPLNILDWEKEVIYDDNDNNNTSAKIKSLSRPLGSLLYAGVISTGIPSSTSGGPIRSVSTSGPSSRPTSPTMPQFSNLPVPSMSAYHHQRSSQPIIVSPSTMMTTALNVNRTASMVSSRASTPGFVSPSTTAAAAAAATREQLAPKSLAGRILNQELLGGRWADQIIWDITQLPSSLPPLTLQLPLSDPLLIFELPPDQNAPITTTAISPAGMAVPLQTLPPILQRPEAAPLVAQKPRVKTKAQHGNRQPSTAMRFDRCLAGEKFNLSNDRHYLEVTSTTGGKEKAGLSSAGGRMHRASTTRIGLQHSVPALKLLLPFYRTFWTKNELRAWHRPHLDVSSSLVKKPIAFEKWVKSRDTAVGRKPVAVLINSAKRLSLRDRTMTPSAGFVMLEYSEEFPLLVTNVGMATFLFNFYRKSQPKEQPPSSLMDRPYGTPRILETQESSPFWIFGDVRPGQTLPAIQNNLFRAPLFDHSAPPTDFILIKYNLKGKTASRFYLKPLPSVISVVGQVFPTAEVYGPHSRRHNAFCRARVQAFAYRLFRKDQPNSTTDTQTLPRLKISRIMAAFPQFSEGSLRKWLKEYADSVRAGQEGGGGTWRMRPDAPVLTEEEIRALVTPEMICQYESMLAGQQRLNDAGLMEAPEMEMLMGIADDEANMSNATATTAASEENSSEGAEARFAPWNLSSNFISASTSRCMLQLRGNGDPSGRGEAFSFVRVPTKISIGGGSSSSKLSSSAVVSAAQSESGEATSEGKGKLSKEQVVYRQEIVKIWDAQMKALSNPVPPPDDNNTNDDLNRPVDDEETTDFSIFEDTKNINMGDIETTSALSRTSHTGRTLVITRVIHNPETGEEKEETETISDNPRLISAYVNQRRGWERKRKRRQIAALASAARAKKPRSGKLLTAAGGKMLKLKIPQRPKKDISVRCGTCGELGHMKTNRICPRYAEYEASLATMADSHEEIHSTGLKISINKAILKTVEDNPAVTTITTGATVVRPAPPIIITKVKKRKGLDMNSLTLEQREAAAKLNEHYLSIMNVLTGSEGSWPFHRPVSGSEYPHYYRLISKPLDFSTMRARIRRNYYAGVKAFLDDLKLVRDNCIQFNGPDHPFSTTITRLVEVAEELLKAEEIASLNERLVGLHDDTGGDEEIDRDPTDADGHVNIDI